MLLTDDENEESESSGLDSPKLPQSISTQAFQHHKGPVRTRSAAFFTLPIELRNAIYRMFVVSPLFHTSHASMYRPLCVDEAMFKIGYFKKTPCYLYC